MIIIDNSPPVPSFSNPTDNAQNVATDSRIFVGFTEKIKPGSGSITLSNQQGDTHRIAIHDRCQVQFNPSNNQDGNWPEALLITPRERFLHNSTYYVQLDAGSITDLAGNANVNPAQLQFSTSADSSAPQLLKQSTSQTGNIVLTFNEPIKQGAGQVIARDLQGAVLDWGLTANIEGNTVEFATSKSVTICPKNIPFNSAYTLEISPNAITDLAGNPVALTGNVKLSATTGSFSLYACNVESTVEISTSTHLSPGTDIFMAPFVYSLKPGVGKLQLSNNQGDIRKIDVNDPRQIKTQMAQNGSGAIGIILDPLENLWPNSLYTLQIESGAITDLTGRNVRFANNASIFQFTTGAADTVAPIALFGRLSGDKQAIRQHIATNASIEGVFNERIKAGTGNIILSNGAGDTRTIAITDTSQINITGTTILIKPSKKLLPMSQYYVLMDNAAVTDLAGNPYIGIQDKTAFTFNTETIWTAASHPVQEINSGKLLGQYEPGDTLVFNFNTPIKDYQYFTLSQHSFGGNDVFLSKDGMSASVLLDNSSTVVPGDVLTLIGCKDSQGYSAEVDFKL